MRFIENAALFLLSLLLMLVGVSILRNQSLSGLSRTLVVPFSAPQKVQVARREMPLQPPKPVTLPAPPTITSREPTRLPAVEVNVTVVSPSAESIHVGMDKARVWEEFGQPYVVTASRDKDRFLETFIYLDEPG